MDTLRWKATLSKLFCFHSENGSALKGKNLLPGANSFLLEQTRFQNGSFQNLLLGANSFLLEQTIFRTGKQTGSHKMLPPL